MTMSSAVSKVTLNGDGVQTSWPFAFKVWEADDLEVSITNAEGVTTVVSNWSVELASVGGTVTYPTSGPPLPTGHKITIARSMDFLQDVDLISGTRWDPEVVETALDQATAERQQLKEKLDRAVTVPISSSMTPEQFADDLFKAVTTGSALVWFAQAGTGAVARTVQDKLREFVSVKDFGAMGDGVTDDHAALSVAIASGRDIYFPAGTYLITQSLEFSNLQNVRLRGSGRDVTKIKCAGDAIFSNSALAFVDSSHIEINGLTLDQNNNASFTATWPLVFFLTSTHVAVRNCSVINVTYIGLGLNQVQHFWIEDNFLEHNTAINSTNYNINVTSTVGNLSRYGVVRGNTMLRSSNIFTGRDIVIDGNVALSSKYGANIATGGDANFVYGSYVVTNNICNYGAGVDTDNINVAGMEIGGNGVIVSNNICLQNGGAGIAVLARNSIISNNICLGNGQNVAATDPYKSGILMAYADASYGAHYCIVVGNRCGDDGSGRQKYGYYEQGAAINNVALMANNFVGNTVAPALIASSTGGFYETNTWTPWTPTITSTAGAITQVGAVSARYRLEQKTVHFIVSATITENGTGAGSVHITVPPVFAGVNGGNQSCSGRESGVTGKQLVGSILNGAQGINVTFYDGTYPGGNGHVIQIQGFYETI